MNLERLTHLAALGDEAAADELRRARVRLGLPQDLHGPITEAQDLANYAASLARLRRPKRKQASFVYDFDSESGTWP